MSKKEKSQKYYRIVDNKGRITIPQAVRKELGLGSGQMVCIKLDDRKAFLEKAERQLLCDCCGAYGQIEVIENLAFCESCLQKVAKKYLDKKSR